MVSFICARDGMIEQMNILAVLTTKSLETRNMQMHTIRCEPQVARIRARLLDMILPVRGAMFVPACFALIAANAWAGT